MRTLNLSAGLQFSIVREDGVSRVHRVRRPCAKSKNNNTPLNRGQATGRRVCVAASRDLSLGSRYQLEEGDAPAHRQSTLEMAFVPRPVRPAMPEANVTKVHGLPKEAMVRKRDYRENATSSSAGNRSSSTQSIPHVKLTRLRNRNPSRVRHRRSCDTSRRSAAWTERLAAASPRHGAR